MLAKPTTPYDDVPPEFVSQIVAGQRISAASELFCSAVIAENPDWESWDGQEGHWLRHVDGITLDVSHAMARALPPDPKELAGLSIGGIDLWANAKAIQAVVQWQQDHATIDDVRTALRHWRDECGKLHAQVRSTNERAARVCQEAARRHREAMIGLDERHDDEHTMHMVAAQALEAAEIEIGGLK